VTRSRALAAAADYFDSGGFLADLGRRVAFPTESAAAQRRPDLLAYLEQEMVPAARRLGADARVLDNPRGGPFLVARRHEADGLPTVLTYGHADVVLAEPARWSAGLDPWRVTVREDRWYGRGTADNKGQHTINLAALEQVLAARGGRLGFNLKILIETSEEIGSPGLGEFCAEHRDELAADVLVASDGPRVAAARPTVFLGSRGSASFTLAVSLRERSYHSGNWGGLLRNPATVLASALACLVDGRGAILVPGLRPPPIPAAVSAALATIPSAAGPMTRTSTPTGASRGSRRPSGSSAGTRWRCCRWPRATRTPRSTPSRGRPGRTASCGSSSAPTSPTWPAPCAPTWAGTGSAWSRSGPGT
jgi:acetylornithine deacetylase/succinyl-diaminopimelate desuccinylase-like protein